MAGTNNFLVFNEANNPTFTMSDADYYADLYRLNGLIPMIADPLAHNKMFRQWSIMIKALADIMASMNYNASDSDLAILETNLKSTIEDVAEAKVDSRITTLEDWKDSITASASEINILDGAEISTTELNYLKDASSNIQTQIDNLSISALFPLWQKNTAYTVGAVVKTLSSSFWVYLECVVAGTSDTTEPTFTNVGELVTDGTAQWLVLDLRDSAPVGTIKQDIIVRDGWLILNGQTINVADYPRLISFLIANSLLNAYTATPNVTEFTYGDSNNETVILPNFEGLFLENSASNTLSGVSAGLPNISGTCGYIRSQKADSTTIDNTINDNTKALKWGFKATNSEEALQNINDSTKAAMGDITLDASRSSSIYGNSNTVQPPAVKLLPIIKY